MKKKELWLYNDTGNDVSISDLNVRVLTKSTVNVFAYNPALQPEQVKRSMKEGSIKRRLDSGILRVVDGPPSAQKTHKLSHIGTSNETIKVVKTKSSIVIDTKSEDVLKDSDFGEIADYGLGDLGHENSMNVKQLDAVVVKQKQDVDEELEEDVVFSIKTKEKTNINEKSVNIMIEQIENRSNPVGAVATNLTPHKPYTVNEQEKGKVPITQLSDKVQRISKPKKIKKVSESVSPEPESVPEVDVKLPETQLPVKDVDGSVVMKVKEETQSRKKK